MRLPALVLLALILAGADSGRAQTPQQSYLRDKPGETRREDTRVSKIIEDAEKHFRLGELNLRDEKPRAAREEFDKALDTVLESGMDVRSNPRLNRYYVELVERVYRYEVPQNVPARSATGAPVDGPADVGFAEQEYVPSPLDELNRGALNPSNLAVFRDNGCGEDAAGGIELRGFKLGMTVAEVKARVPNLRLKAADSFNFVDYSAAVRTDKYLSLAPQLKGVESISFEFLDDRVSSVLFVYDNSPRWESGEKFATQVSSALGLKVHWVNYRTGPTSPLDDVKYTVCRDTVLMAGLTWLGHRQFPAVRIRDLAAHALWHQRRRAAADRKREAEENRRRWFKP
jgi:hypothetical protein